MAYRINIPYGSGVTFDYGGKFTFSALRWNPYMFCWVCDLLFDDYLVKSLAIRGGVNILRKFNIPMNLYIVNSKDPTIDPIDYSSIVMYVLEQGDLQEAVLESNILVNV